ncbi:MAG TPA: glycosyltransferase family 4 protein [Acidimicrobiales bacterium]|nr:glycosyltransferase family 4 protein [Acidimicrobiales bacterium]
MKVAYVVPRYGLEVLGGAEYGARMLAERLVSQLGYEVEVLTTCALDAGTWRNEYSAGEVDINGVRVRRFASHAGRDPNFDQFSRSVLAQPEAADQAAGERWIELQGPVCPDVVAAAHDTDADLVVFYPYLYYPTVHGVPAVGPRAVMHPAAHDEPPLRLPIFRDVFARTQAFVFQTYGERRLAESLFAIGDRAHIVMGLGVEEGEGGPADFGLGDRPYLLCLGRVDDGKGAGMLARYFAEYKARRPGPLALVFAGPVVNRPPAHPDIVVAGPVDEDVKWGALRTCAALVNPSYFEAFSIVLMEAWTAGVPVVVNGHCNATREHCERSGGGLWFEGFAEFEAAVDRLTTDGATRAALAEAGAAYVDANFRWPVIIERYGRFLTSAASRAHAAADE